MDYILTILSSGRQVYFERMLSSLAFLSPRPSAVFVYDDGAQLQKTEATIGASSIAVAARAERIGQCRAHAECWQAAADANVPWAFHIEDDMVLLRPVDLISLAAAMEWNRDLAQMALVRTPWGAEVEHGGYIPMTPGHYERKNEAGVEWVETARNWTNAPCLFRTSLAAANEWPQTPGCETDFSETLRQKRFRFGLWGGGECWVAHIGVERAKGSHGY